jgi:large subunit ribosomal protein L7/L12
MSEGLSTNVQNIVSTVENLTVLELSQLVKALEERFGVSASAPVLMSSGGAAPAAVEEEVEEKTQFTPMLTEIGPDKIKVIKVVREFTSMGLKEAKEFVEGTLPASIKDDVSKQEAEDIKKKFEEAGAKVVIK